MDNFEAGRIYTNRNGDAYRLKEILTTLGGLVFERISDNWTLVAHGTNLYPDGTIDWAYSTGGHWPVKEVD